MFNKPDLQKNEFMLTGPLRRKGYDWWWHSFTGRNAKTGEERAFFIEFFVCNPALGWEEPVLGQLPENRKRGKRPSYLMVKAGTWGEDGTQLHRFFPWKDVKLRGKAPYSISAGDCYASDTVLKGRVDITPEEAKSHPEWMCGSGSLRWELLIDKQTAFNVGYGTSHLLRFLKAFEMYWHAEGMKTGYTGSVWYNEEEYIITPETCYGYADKNWGRNFTSPWVWLSSNDLKSNRTGEVLSDSVFDIGGGCPKVYFVPLKRKLLSAFWYEGTPYEFNFSKFWTLTRTQFDFHETDDDVFWHVRQETTRAVMDVNITCRKKDMLLINYEAPDGTKRHNRLWNGGTGTGTVSLYEKSRGTLFLVDEVSAGHIGCEYGEYD